MTSPQAPVSQDTLRLGWIEFANLTPVFYFWLLDVPMIWRKSMTSLEIHLQYWWEAPNAAPKLLLGKAHCTFLKTTGVGQQHLPHFIKTFSQTDLLVTCWVGSFSVSLRNGVGEWIGLWTGCVSGAVATVAVFVTTVSGVSAVLPTCCSYVDCDYSNCSALVCDSHVLQRYCVWLLTFLAFLHLRPLHSSDSYLTLFDVRNCCSSLFRPIGSYKKVF